MSILGNLLLLLNWFILVIEFLDISNNFNDKKVLTGNFPYIWLLFSLIVNTLGNDDLNNGYISVILLNDKSIYYKLDDIIEPTLLIEFFFTFIILIYGVTNDSINFISYKLFLYKFKIDNFYICSTLSVDNLLLDRCNYYRHGVFPVDIPVISLISLESSYNTFNDGKFIEGNELSALNLISSYYSLGNEDAPNLYISTMLFLFSYNFINDYECIHDIDVILF